MTLAEKVMTQGSVAIAGLAKNTGKTVTLNHLLREMYRKGHKAGVTSIGIDGESTDQVSGTRKPEIRLYEGTLFATGETHYRTRRAEAEISGIMPRWTATGRVVTGRILADGKMLLSGPSDTASMREVIAKLRNEGAETVLVDGALSRKSQASPTVTDALVLATGAAVSPVIQTIAARTAYICRLASLPAIDEAAALKLEPLEGDLYGIDSDGVPSPLGLTSSLNFGRMKDRLLMNGTTIYNPGVVTDRFIKYLSSLKETDGIQLIVRDFTRLFVEQATLAAFLRKGGKVSVMRKSRLLGVTVNPYSPTGYKVDKDRLIDTLREKIDVTIEYIDPGK